MKFNHKKLAQARREKHLSAYKASRELSKFGMDVSHQTILNWEKGDYFPNCHQLAEMAIFYGKDVGYFFSHKTHHNDVVSIVESDRSNSPQ